LNEESKIYLDRLGDAEQAKQSSINLTATLTFSQRGSINVNKSLLLAFDFNTSAPPELPNMISPACFDASIATERSLSSTSGEGNSILLDDIILVVIVDDDARAASSGDFKLKKVFGTTANESTAVITTRGPIKSMKRG
jgi:hypothetical protein